MQSDCKGSFKQVKMIPESFSPVYFHREMSTRCLNLRLSLFLAAFCMVSNLVCCLNSLWYMLREVVEAPSLETFKTRLDRALSNLI